MVGTLQFESAWTFGELGQQTRVTIRMRFSSAQECQRVARKYGLIEGGHQTLARLAEFLPRLAEQRQPKVASCEADPTAKHDVVE